MELFAAGSTSSRSVNGMAQTTDPEISSERAYVLLGVNRHSRFHKVAPITPSLRPPTTALAPSENRRFQVTAYVSLLLIRDEWAHLSLRIQPAPTLIFFASAATPSTTLPKMLVHGSV